MSNLQNKPSRLELNEIYHFSDFNVQQQYEEQKYSLENESHKFIVFLGALIGGIFSLFIGYSLNLNFSQYLFLSILPIGLAYILRKVYINTIIKTQ